MRGPYLIDDPTAGVCTRVADIDADIPDAHLTLDEPLRSLYCGRPPEFIIVETNGRRFPACSVHTTEATLAHPDFLASIERV